MGENMNFPEYDVIQQPLQEEVVEVKDTGFLTSNFEILKSEGFLSVPEDFKFDGSIEAYKKAHEFHFESLKNQAREEVLLNVPEKVKSVIEAALSGIDDPEVLLQISKTNTVEPTTEKEKVLFMEKVLQEKGLDEVAIETVIDKYKKDGTLDSKIKEVVKQNNKLLQERIEQEKAAQQQSIEKFKEQTATSLGSFEWPDAKKALIQDMIFKPTEKGVTQLVDVLNNVFADPNNLVMLAEFLSFYKDGKLDVKSFTNEASNRVVKVKTTWDTLLQNSNKQEVPRVGVSDQSIKYDELFF